MESENEKNRPLPSKQEEDGDTDDPHYIDSKSVKKLIRVLIETNELKLAEIESEKETHRQEIEAQREANKLTYEVSMEETATTERMFKEKQTTKREQIKVEMEKVKQYSNYKRLSLILIGIVSLIAAVIIGLDLFYGDKRISTIILTILAFVIGSWTKKWFSDDKTSNQD